MSQSFEVTNLISEPKHDYFVTQQSASELVRTHFSNLRKFESQYFADFTDWPTASSRMIPKREINNIEHIDWVKASAPDCVLLFGTGILSDEWVNAFPNRIINLHLGSSPRYRGSATLFWPFVNREIDYVAATIHLAVQKVDAGPILDWVKPQIAPSDHYYDITNKTIKSAIGVLPQIVSDYLRGELEPVEQDLTQQAFLYKRRDFSAEVLKQVLDRYFYHVSKRAEAGRASD